MPLSVQTQPLVPPSRPYPPGLASAADAVQRAGGPIAEELAAGLRNADASLNLLHRTLRQQSPVVNKIAVVDSTGKVIAAIGDFIFGGVPATNYFSELHAGDPLNTGDPSQALFNANTDGSVTIGQHGWLDVLDPYGADAAWIGTQFDTLVVTGAADNGAGLIRLEVIGHTLATNDVAQVLKVVGVTSATNGTSNANGTFSVTKIDANHIDLQNSVFVGAYVSGGTVDRLLHIAGVADNGSGLARIQTAVPHTYESGDRVNLQGVGSGLNTQWTVNVIDATHFDLVGSTFTGGSNGTSLRYFAGGLFQTIAIGPSFQDYRLRAFADGTLRLRNATIVLDGAGGTITLDPATPAITVSDNDGNEWAALEIVEELPIAISAATNASPSVLTVVGNTYVNGDTLTVAGALGNTAINGYRIVRNVGTAGAGTFTMTDIAGAQINGNGAYTGSGTATRYYAGGLFQSIAIGPDWANAKLRGYADGSLRIQNATIDLSSTAGEIVLDPSVPSIGVTSTTTTEVSSIDPVGGFMQTDGTLTFQALSGAATVTSAAFFSRLAQGTVNVGALPSGNIHARLDADGGSGGGSVAVFTSAGTYRAGLEVIAGHGALCVDGLGTQVVGPRLAAITAPTINTTAISQTAGATYTVNEQAMLASLKAAVNQLNTDVTNLQSAVNTIISRLQTHGLTS